MLLQAEASQLVPSWLFSYLRERWRGSSREMRACLCARKHRIRVTGFLGIKFSKFEDSVYT